MARFGSFKRFEVKNEMKDVKKINQDTNKQTGGKSSSQSQEEIKKEANKIGFDDEIDFTGIDDLTQKYRNANAQVEYELEQYYDDEITLEELKAYLITKITEIYGEKLNQCNVLIDIFVEEFLNYYQFNGVESYRQLVRITEETIIDMTNKMKKSKNAEESVEKNGIQAISEEKANKIGFDDEIDFAGIDDLTQKYRNANAQVEYELEQYYDDEITLEELKAYLITKITEIYGEKLNQCNVLIDIFVEEFLNYYQFNGVESYRQLVRITEETIIDMTNKMKKSKNAEESVEKNGIQAISEEKAKKLVLGYQMMLNQSELSANAYINTQAKKLGVDKKELISFVLAKGKEKITSPEKVLHYHRTSIQSFKQIMQIGYLLNRRNMQENGLDISKLRGSSSANVQFSRDIYDDNGVLQVEGYNKERNLGANSTDVIFVMGPELMQENTYNCLSVYPTVEKANIQKYCIVILAKDPIIQMQVEKILKEKNIFIRTILQENFDRNILLAQLSKNNSSKHEKDTGFTLKSVNDRDKLTTRVTATNQQPQQISPLQANTIYKEYIKYRACLKDKSQFLSFLDYAKQFHNIENKNETAVNEGLKEEIRGVSR